MNILKLKTGYDLAKDRDRRQAKIDAEVEVVLEELNLDAKDIFATRNIDFLPQGTSKKYKYLAFVAGLNETLVIQDTNTYETVYSREEA